MRLVITGLQESKSDAVIFIGEKIKPFVATHDIIARDDIVMAVARNDSVIAHARNKITFDLGILRKAHPDAVESAANRIVVDFITGAESQFDRVIKHI